MKKIIAAVLMLICILGLVGCTNNSDPNPFDTDADGGVVRQQGMRAVKNINR